VAGEHIEEHIEPEPGFVDGDRCLGGEDLTAQMPGPAVVVAGHQGGEG
jgi:hypothetical protein